MAEQVGIQVEGAAELRRTMRRAGVALTDLKDGHREAAEVVAKAAKPRTPRQSGRLAASGRAGATQGAALIRFGGAAVPYAGPIHWGWPARNIKAQPWVAETAEDTQPAWEAAYLHAVERVLDTIKGT